MRPGGRYGIVYYGEHNNEYLCKDFHCDNLKQYCAQGATYDESRRLPNTLYPAPACYRTYPLTNYYERCSTTYAKLPT